VSLEEEIRTHIQREDYLRIQREVGHLQAKERNLRRNNSDNILTLDF
jgi:predicted transposase YbfD/YdcC